MTCTHSSLISAESLEAARARLQLRSQELANRQQQLAENEAKAARVCPEPEDVLEPVDRLVTQIRELERQVKAARGASMLLLQ